MRAIVLMMLILSPVLSAETNCQPRKIKAKIDHRMRSSLKVAKEDGHFTKYEPRLGISTLELKHITDEGKAVLAYSVSVGMHKVGCTKTIYRSCLIGETIMNRTVQVLEGCKLDILEDR